MKETILENHENSPYPAWHYQPLRLLKEEMENPMGVIKDFFSNNNLPQMRKHFKEMLEDAMCAVEVYSVNYLTLYDNFEKLAEAAWLLLQRSKAITAEQKETELPGSEIRMAVIRLLATALRPERIFLLSGEENTHIDLLIVVPDTPGKPFSQYGTIVEIACHYITNLSFSLHAASQFWKFWEEAHPSYLFTCTAGNEVYRDEAVLPLPLPGAMAKETEWKAEESFYPAFTRAASFFECAKHCFEGSDLASALFMLHATAELSLRAVICALTGSEVKEHSISILAKHIRRCSPALFTMLSPGTEKEKENLSLLESAYRRGRYDNSFAPGREDILLLMKWVEDIHNACDNAFTTAMKTLCPVLHSKEQVKP